jgi:hypothetical protein
MKSAEAQLPATHPHGGRGAGLPRVAADQWAKTSAARRQAIAETVFERIDVLGVTDFSFKLTAHAWGEDDPCPVARPR